MLAIRSRKTLSWLVVELFSSHHAWLFQQILFKLVYWSLKLNGVGIFIFRLLLFFVFQGVATRIVLRFFQDIFFTECIEFICFAFLALKFRLCLLFLVDFSLTFKKLLILLCYPSQDWHFELCGCYRVYRMCFFVRFCIYKPYWRISR